MYEDKIYKTWRMAQEMAAPVPAPIVEKKQPDIPEPMPEELNPTTDLSQAENIAQEAKPAEAEKIEEMQKPAAGANREEQVKQSIGELSTYINEVAKAVYQMQLTQNQSQEITTKIVTMISDYISNITVERVKNIAEQFMKVEAKKRVAKVLGTEYKITAMDYRKMTVLSPEDVKYINTLSPYVKAYAWQLAGIAKTEGMKNFKNFIFSSYTQLKNKLLGADEKNNNVILQQFKEMAEKIFGVTLP